MRNQKISLAEPITELRHVKIIDNGEPLIEYLPLSPRLIHDKPRYDYHREALARKSVAEALAQAADKLPPGMKLAVIEGWRPLHIQKRMYLSAWKRFQDRHPDWSETQLRRVVNRFTAPVASKVPPPHSTGGAVDVTLVNEEGRQFDMISPYEMFNQHAFPFAAKKLSDTARRHRDIVAAAFEGTVLTNYPSEYWHWSYGDQGWAYRGGHPHALYGPIEPPGYTPPERDNVLEPLEWVWTPPKPSI
jgi:D-alanyl-D-alanine dipeptidase